MTRLPALGWILSLIVFVSGWAFAQAPTASITGVVQDSSQAAIPNATVTATSEETGLSRAVQTASDGHYVVLSLPIGLYDVKAEAPSFSSVLQKGLVLTVSKEAVINFTLNVGSVSQEVSVSAEAPLVETTNGTLGGLVNEERVSDLPLNGRNFTDLTLMQTGIQVNYHAQSTAVVNQGNVFMSNGAGVMSNMVELDGANIKQGNGYSSASIVNTQLGVEGIREFLVVTNSFKAEYGMVVGSHTIIATKSGTNQFHGSAFDYLRNNALAARNILDPSGPGAGAPPFHRNNFGGSIGGPIMKNKTFFFVTYEGIRQTQGVSFQNTTFTSAARLPGFYTGLTGQTSGTTTAGTGGAPSGPVASVMPYLALYPLPNGGCVSTDPTAATTCNSGLGYYNFTFPTPSREDYMQARVDETLSDKDSFFGRYTFDNTMGTRINSFPGFNRYLSGRGQFVTLAETHIFSTSLLNTARFSYSRPNIYFNSPGLTSLGFLPGLVMGTISPGSVGSSGTVSSIGGANTDPFQILQNLFTLSDDVSWTHGAHTFKFGTLINRYQVLGLNNASTTGSYSFTSVDRCNNSNPATVTANTTCFLYGLPANLNIATPGSHQDRTLRWYTLGFYAQDDWRLTSRFTLNLGLRYEANTTVNEVSGKPWSSRNRFTDSFPGDPTGSTFFNVTDPADYNNPSAHNFGPRVGFAWDIFGNQKTSLRGGFAYLYDLTTETAGATTVATGQPPYSSLSTANNNQPCGGAASFRLGFPDASTIPACFKGKTVRMVNWNLNQPHMLEYNLTLERQLPGNMSIAVSYAGTRGYNLLGITDGNPTQYSVFQPNGLPLWTGNTNCTVPSATCEPYTNPHFQANELRDSAGQSFYNSLQAKFEKRLSRGLQFQASYTWARCLDRTQGQVAGEAAGSSSQGVFPFNPHFDQGNCDWGTLHTLVMNGLYNIPSPIQSGFGKTALGGWRIGTIITLKTGQPFTVTDSGNASRSNNASYSGFVADRVDVVPGCHGEPLYFNNSTHFFNADCFAPQPLVTAAGIPGCIASAGPPVVTCYGRLGNEARNSLFGPAFRTWDLSLTKDTPLHWLGEAGGLEFRVEAFNLLNHTAYGTPSRSIYTYTNTTAPPTAPLSTYGQMKSWVYDSREIQLALKLKF